MTLTSGLSASNFNTKFVAHSRYNLDELRDPDQVRTKLSEYLQENPNNITVDMEGGMSMVRREA